MRFTKLILVSLCICSLTTSCKEKSEVQEIQKKVPLTREEETLSYAAVVKKVAPAVVNIYAFHHGNVKLPVSPFMADPFFRQFFEHLQREHDSRQDSLGSGVIVSKEGLVLTNYHVVEGADVVKVAFSNKREYIAKIVAIDKRTDLALLKIEGSGDFPYLDARAQEDIEVGDVVLALGNPFGVGQTVTTGIVSALARSQEGINDFRTFIQTDAAINPGNSGGALVTTDGRLIGINTAIYSKSGGSMGIGFAVPIDLAIPVIESVKHGGRVLRPWIGLKIQSLSLKEAEALGLDRPYGVFVRGVYPGGPADKAGIKTGDFILSVDGREIADDSSLSYLIGTAPIGKKTEFKIIRNGKEIKIPVVLDVPMGEEEVEPAIIKGDNPLQGSKLLKNSPAVALDMGLTPWQGGIVVLDVLEESPAAQLGLQPGDVIETINRQEVKTIEEVMKALETSSRSWFFTIWRGKKLLKFQARG